MLEHSLEQFSNFLKSDLRAQVTAEIDQKLADPKVADLTPRQKTLYREQLQARINEVGLLAYQATIWHQEFANRIIELGFEVPSVARLQTFLQNPTESVGVPTLPAIPEFDELEAYKALIQEAEEKFEGYGAIVAEDKDEKQWQMRKSLVMAGFEMNKGIKWVTPLHKPSLGLEFQVLNFDFSPEVPLGMMAWVYSNLGEHMHFIDPNEDLAQALMGLMNEKVKNFDMPTLYRNTLMRKGLADAMAILSTSPEWLGHTSTQFSLERGNGLPHLLAALIKKGIFPKSFGSDVS